MGDKKVMSSNSPPRLTRKSEFCPREIRGKSGKLHVSRICFPEKSAYRYVFKELRHRVDMLRRPLILLPSRRLRTMNTMSKLHPSQKVAHQEPDVWTITYPPHQVTKLTAEILPRWRRIHRQFILDKDL
jgi:hypothetical protein